MKTNDPYTSICIAMVVIALIVAGSVIYLRFRESPVAVAGDTAVEIQDELGNSYVVEYEESLKVTIITDQTCDSCDTAQAEKWLKSQVGMPLAVRRLDYSTTDAKDLVQANQALFLPYLLIDKEIAKHPNFTHLTHHVISAAKTGYYLDLVKMGKPVGRYLDAAYYTKDDPAAPRITVAVTEYDFGIVPLSGGKISTEFAIINEGQSDLEFLTANTSCGCTSVQIDLGDETSPEYMMAGHQEPVHWRGILTPGEEGVIRVFYDPTVHPDLNKAVTREVTIDTNDPNTPQLKLKIQANQIPE